MLLRSQEFLCGSHKRKQHTTILAQWDATLQNILVTIIYKGRYMECYSGANILVAQEIRFNIHDDYAWTIEWSVPTLFCLGDCGVG